MIWTDPGERSSCRPSAVNRNQPGLQVGRQLGNGNAKGIGNALDIPQRQISFSALDAADIRAIQLALQRKLFLRPIPFPTELSDALAKPHQDVRFFRHAGI